MKLTIEQLNRILDSHIALHKVMELAISVGCMDPNGSLYNTLWKGFEDMIDIVDPKGWIQWYIYDNEMGDGGLKVIIDGTDYPIENRRDLLNIINIDSK